MDYIQRAQLKRDEAEVQGALGALAPGIPQLSLREIALPLQGWNCAVFPYKASYASTESS